MTDPWERCTSEVNSTGVCRSRPTETRQNGRSIPLLGAICIAWVRDQESGEPQIKLALALELSSTIRARRLHELHRLASNIARRSPRVSLGSPKAVRSFFQRYALSPLINVKETLSASYWNHERGELSSRWRVVECSGALANPSTRGKDQEYLKTKPDRP